MITDDKINDTAKVLIERWYNYLGLGDWTIDIRWNTDPDWENQGDCQCTYGRKYAAITLKSTVTFENLRDTIIHELVHVVFWRSFNSPVLLEESKIIPKKAYDLWFKMFEESVEYDIDSLTNALCRIKLLNDDDLRF